MALVQKATIPSLRIEDHFMIDPRFVFCIRSQIDGRKILVINICRIHDHNHKVDYDTSVLFLIFTHNIECLVII